MHYTPSWPVPFGGRNHSGAVTQNFLWRQGSSYIMDNHRAAMWCWLQEIKEAEPVCLMHIDEHYDTLYANIEAELAAMPGLKGLSIADYLTLSRSVGPQSSPLIRWDNYLSLFLERYGEQVKRSFFITHKVGDKPRHHNAKYAEPKHVPNNIDYWMNQFPDQWLINIDLDYFFCDQGGLRKPMFSDQYVETVFAAIAKIQQAGRIRCLTMCLSPDERYSGSWQQAEDLCSTACRILGLQFSLPTP